MMLTAEESKERYQTHLGAEAGSAFYEVVGQILLLHSKWGDYLALYGKEGRVNLLNESAPEFFGRLQDTLLDDVMLHLARLTDPEKIGRKANLSIKGLVARLSDRDHADSLEPSITDLDDKVSAARDWRNRRIAHTDYDLAVGAPVTPLLPTSRNAIGAAIEALAALINAITVHYMQYNIGFDINQDPATDLIFVLDDGVRAEKRRKAKWSAGEHVPPEEWPARDL